MRLYERLYMASAVLLLCLVAYLVAASIHDTYASWRAAGPCGGG